jgi:hypothetical protein
LASEFATLGTRESTAGVAEVLVADSVAGWGGGAAAQALNPITANAANDQASNPAARLVFAFDLLPLFKLRTGPGPDQL